MPGGSFHPRASPPLLSHPRARPPAPLSGFWGHLNPRAPAEPQRGVVPRGGAGQRPLVVSRGGRGVSARSCPRGPSPCPAGGPQCPAPPPLPWSRGTCAGCRVGGAALRGPRCARGVASWEVNPKASLGRKGWGVGGQTERGGREEGIANSLRRGRKWLDFGFPDLLSTFSVVI